jgi:hypothetical protein
MSQELTDVEWTETFCILDEAVDYRSYIQFLVQKKLN